jgi:hypothetical protein
MGNHTTKGKIKLSAMLVLSLGLLYHMAEAWNEGNRRLEQAEGRYVYYTPSSYKPAAPRVSAVRRLQDLEPAAGGY